MSATLTIIKERFPGRATLIPEEVAEIIFGKSDPATVQNIRVNLKKGILVEGLRKKGGRWLVPVGPLADALDGVDAMDGPLPLPKNRMTRHTVVLGQATQAKRGRTPDAVRLGKIKEWSIAVLGALDEIEHVRGLSYCNEIGGRMSEALSQTSSNVKRNRF